MNQLGVQDLPYSRKLYLYITPWEEFHTFASFKVPVVLTCSALHSQSGMVLRAILQVYLHRVRKRSNT